MERLTDQCFIAYVSKNHGLEEIKLNDGCNLLTDASLTAIAEHCHQMKYLDITRQVLMTKQCIDNLYLALNICRSFKRE